MRLFKLAMDEKEEQLKLNQFLRERDAIDTRAKNKLSFLSQFVTSDTNPEFFIHFGTVDRVGINPKSTYSTPNGFYCYPFTKAMFNDFVRNMLPFAADQPYIHIVSCKSKLLNMKSYSDKDLRVDLDKIRFLFKVE